MRFTLCLAILFMTTVSKALVCEGVSASDIPKIIQERGAVSFLGQIRYGAYYTRGYIGCSGVPNYTPMFYYNKKTKTVGFFECRSGQPWFDPDDTVGGASCY